MAAETEKEKPKSNDKDAQKPTSSSAEPVSQSSTDEKENEASVESDSSSDQPAVSTTSPAKSTDKTVDETVAKPSANKSTPESSSASDSAVLDSQVEQKLAEMMDMDASDLGDKDSDSVKDTERQSTASNASIGDLNDLNDEADEMDVSDVSSSIAENENESKTPSPRKKPKKRQPPIMIGYKKRRKVHSKKIEDEIKIESEIGSPINESVDEKSADESKKLDQSGSSDDNASETSSTSTSRSVRKFSATYNEVALIDKYCWICHKEGPTSYKCIACPRVYHPKCLTQTVEDPNNFHCPECSAILKADNVNTRSPVMQAVNLDQLCTLLKHVIDIIKIQRDAHYFFGPVDTKEFPHYREYVVNPMDILMLEKNVKNKMYGCTEAFLADMKWIVHNSIVFNTKTAKITNVAKNLLKTCKREVSEIETCAECYYNLLVRKDTWFIEVCKRPHLLIWARLKGYPPWPAKAIKCKDEMVDCRFFGAHDKAWVPLKDVYLYSKVSPQIVKIKPGSNLDEGIQEIEKHIKKLKEKFGSFEYAEYREPYNPSAELEQLQSMLPNFNPDSSTSSSKSAPPASADRSKPAIKPKTLFNESAATSTSTASGRKSPSPDTDVSTASAKIEPSTEDPVSTETTISTDTNESTTAETTKLICDESSLPASGDSGASNIEAPKNTGEDKPASVVAEPSEPEEKISTVSSAASDKARDTTDTEAEESDSSRSTTKSTSAGEPLQRIEGMDRKLVSVKKIELINATVAPAPERKVTRPVPIAPKPVPGLVATNPLASLTTIVNSTMASTNGQFTRKINDSKIETVRSVKVVEDVSGKPKSKITVKNFASFEKCDTSTNGKSSPSTQTPPLAPIVARKEPVKVVKPSNEPDYDLDKVKDEPIEVDMSPQSEDPIFVREIPAPTRVTANKPILPKTAPEVTHRKRSMVEDIDSSVTETGKKSKNDPNCRTVNITENVTLSLINNQHQLTNVVENVPAVPAKTQAILKSKPSAKTFVVASNVSSADTPTLTNTHTHTNTITKPVRIAPAPGPTPIRMFTTAQQQRIVNGNATMNGTVTPRSNILVVQSPKQPVKNPTFGVNGTGDIMGQFMSELFNNNRKAMEDTLDKIAGKGDLRAKVILLQKEIENMKRNHEMMIDEIKRDYEVQIAELRAASIAQKKYDLAHERLKLEKEKELAVKEAKSKQWCSNCQKSANYYCCWNTAYCDFECQKEHWNQHMHVCKNDVKRKAAECSENEPPRIMMQNDGLSEYKSMMNGYDKMATATYSYPSSNHVSSSSRSNGTKMQMKSSGAKNPRPLLPRVTATVTCSPSVYSSSTPAVTATLVDNSYPNVSTTVTPLRSTMIGSVNVHPLIRQAQQQLHNKQSS